LLKLQIPRENRMNVHENARLTPRGRERIVRQVESGLTPEAVAETAGVCPRTVRKWVDRYRPRAGGIARSESHRDFRRLQLLRKWEP
jgi:transposase-like protein